ncbi:hypothetical protein D3C86_1611030 [compost metagenome]
MGAKACRQIDEIVIGGITPLNLDGALLHHHPGFAGAMAYVETGAGDRDLAAARRDHKGSAGVVLDAEHRFAFAQLNVSLILFKAHQDPAAAVQIHHRAVRQRHMAALIQGC